MCERLSECESGDVCEYHKDKKEKRMSAFASPREQEKVMCERESERKKENQTVREGEREREK